MQQIQKVTPADVFRALLPNATLREFTQVVLLGQESVLRRHLAQNDIKDANSKRKAFRKQDLPVFTGLARKENPAWQPKGFANVRRMRLIRLRLVQIPRELRQKFADEAGVVLPTIESVLAGGNQSHEKTARLIEAALDHPMWSKYLT